MNLFMTVSEVAEYLNVKQSWIRSQVFNGKIPYKKIGRLIRFDRKSIDGWLIANEKAEVFHGK